MERETLAIIDASVVVKWFNAEEFSESAEYLKEKHMKAEITLVSPVMMVFEVLNALRYNPELGADDVKEALNDLLGIQIKLYPVEEWLSEAISLAYDRGLTVYDASYIALAGHLGCLLYTADTKLLEKVKAANIRHIADLQD
ncbi:MAG: type II toxin-antitoxin system VapC family toxin [Nitrososphaerales archaeon]